jgi:hypothetical protein
MENPRGFRGAGRGPELLREIGERMTADVDFARDFSSAAVPCGTGGTSFWFVNRRTGEVMEAPDAGVPERQTLIDGQTRGDSDIATLIYAERDGMSGRCSSRRFRWTGRAFDRLGGSQAVRCPD